MAPGAWGLKYEEVQSLTWLAYKGQGTTGTWNFPNAGSTWRVTSVFERGSFRAVLVEGKKRVLALSGTDDLGDWADNIGQGVTGVSGQYLYALRVARSTAPEVVVGHSLGGGLASYCAIYGGRPAATINPAALNTNLVSAVAMMRNSSLVVNYVASGEILDLLDIAAPNMRRVGIIHRVGSSGGWWNPVARHGIANLDGFEQPERA